MYLGTYPERVGIHMGYIWDTLGYAYLRENYTKSEGELSPTRVVCPVSLCCVTEGRRFDVCSLGGLPLVSCELCALNPLYVSDYDLIFHIAGWL